MPNRRPKLLIKNGNVFRAGQLVKKDLLVCEGVFSVFDDTPVDPESITIDASGCYILPGFIDIHLHGGGGFDIMSCNQEELLKLSRWLTTKGVTAFLPTLISSGPQDLKSALKSLETAKKRITAGAIIVGVNMEGPFISKVYGGAHERSLLKEPSIKEYMHLFKEHEGLIKMITMAPELKGVKELAEHISQKGIVLAIGHSNATYEKVMESISWGYRHSTHLYNAMSGFHHRHPGTVGAILDRLELSTELIADLIHLHPSALRLAVKAKGIKNCVLISDAMAAAGMQDGNYYLGRQLVRVNAGLATLADGTIAGSTLTLDMALANMVKLVGISLPEAVAMVSEVPARVVGIDHYKGKLEPGYDADIVIMNNDLKVLMTLIKGDVKYPESYNIESKQRIIEMEHSSGSDYKE